MSSWHVNQLKYGLGIGSLVSFYGIVSMTVFVAGRYFGLTLSFQIVMVALLLLTMPFALVIGYFATRTKKEKPTAETAPAAESSSEKSEKLVKPVGQYEEITAGTVEAAQFLQSSNLGGDSKGGREAVYKLPFFMFAGAPRSGKTSLVLSSDLNFQPLPSQRQSEQMLVRPTRAIDWRVTSDAVLIDTAGRYQTDGADADEWAAMLETLKKHRAARPLDGFVLAINSERILNADDEELESQAKLLRARLDEAMQRAKTRFPVYLVFTNADVIEGFQDSFSVSSQDGKNLILGATFPLDEAESAHTLFDREFGIIQQRILERRLRRLSAPFPPVRQLRIFNFPLHFGSAGRRFGSFVNALFRPNPFNTNPLFRGFYFTASIAGKNQANVGTSYFAARFFRDVLLRDRNLAAAFAAQKQRPRLLGWILLGAGTLAVLTLLGGATVSLINNSRLLEEASGRGRRVLDVIEADKGRDPLTKSPVEARNEVEAVEDLRASLVQLDEYDRDGAPSGYGFGLYSGNRLYHERLLPIYFDAVEQRYKKPVVKRLEDDLRRFAANQSAPDSANLSTNQEKELDRHYDLLKAYLMLSGDYRDRAEATFLANQLGDYWRKSSPDELENISRQQLDFYAKQALRDEFPRIKLDQALVDGARRKLQAYPAVFRYYKRVTTDVDKQFEPVSVDSILAGRSAGVLSGAYTVPGSFTIDGYRNAMRAAIDTAGTELGKADWVMGERSVTATATAVDISRLEARYFNEYTDHWRKFVENVQVQQIARRDDAVNVLKQFSASESPLETLVREIARHTNLSAKQKPDGIWGWITSFFATPKAAPTAPVTEVEREFRPLFAFVGDGSKPEGAPVSGYRADLRRLVQPLETASESKIRDIAKDLAAEKDMIGLGKVETSVNNRLEPFGQTTAGQEIAEMLQQPLTNLRVFFGADERKQIEDAWSGTVLAKARAVETGFPFTDEGEADLQKLAQFFSPNARGEVSLTKFYDSRIERYFENEADKYTVKEDSKIKFSDEFVKYLNNAFELRQALFGKGVTPNFEYEFSLQPVENAVVEITIDGQKVRSEGTQSAKFVFPASSGETGALIEFAATEAAATGSTDSGFSSAPTPATANSAVNSNANVSAANVNTANANAAAVTKPSTASTDTGTKSLRFPGQWGLFKMFEAGAPQKTANGEYQLTWKLGGKSVTASIKASGGDPFNRSLYRNLRAPQTLLKQ